MKTTIRYALDFFSGIYRFNILTVYCALRPTFNDGALTPRIMAIPVVESSREGYKIRKVFG